MTDSSIPRNHTRETSGSEPRGTGHPPGLLERAYPLSYSRPDWFAVVPLALAGLLLGTASYESLRSEPMTEYRSMMLFGAAVGLAVFVYRTVTTKKDVLVGDAGVGLRQSGDITRLLWWEIQSIRYSAGELILQGETTTLRLPSVCHASAIREILAQAAERLPSILDVKSKLVDELPAASKGGEPGFEPVSSLQIAGKRCAVSRAVIAIERDARVCPTCTSVYHRSHLPKRCVKCQCELGKKAVAP